MIPEGLWYGFSIGNGYREEKWLKNLGQSWSKIQKTVKIDQKTYFEYLETLYRVNRPFRIDLDRSRRSKVG